VKQDLRLSYNRSLGKFLRKLFCKEENLILFIEPISKNIDMYIPAYPLPLMEVGSFVKSNLPEVPINIISIPIDYGLPLSPEGKKEIYQKLLKDISDLNPKGIGISCTGIAQADEVINLCEKLKSNNPDSFIFLGGYFPTIYFEEIFLRTSSVDLIVVGEGEIPTLRIAQSLEKGENPRKEDINNLVWKENGKIHKTQRGSRFDLGRKALINLNLLRTPDAYEVLPYAFSRGCPYQCNFCMEEFIRPQRKEVPPEIIRRDLSNLSDKSKISTLLISDALFQSFNLAPLIESLYMKINFETRCDTLDPLIIPGIANICGTIALGLESASYDTLKRMNKVRNREHYQKYLNNALAIFKEAVRHEVPIMVFMIAGYPGDTEKDLEETLNFAKGLSKFKGRGGSIFKIGECRIYPRTKLYKKAFSMPDLIFDDDGVFGQNIVRQPSKGLSFEMVLDYIKEIFHLSNLTPKFQTNMVRMMPFFRLPAEALLDPLIPDACYRDHNRNTFNVRGASLNKFRELSSTLTQKYKEGLADQRSRRNLSW
jgi:Radical SAM superfamily/B12 binding domain